MPDEQGQVAVKIYGDASAVNTALDSVIAKVEGFAADTGAALKAWGVGADKAMSAAAQASAKYSQALDQVEARTNASLARLSAAHTRYKESVAATSKRFDREQLAQEAEAETERVTIAERGAQQRVKIAEAAQATIRKAKETADRALVVGQEQMNAKVLRLDAQLARAQGDIARAAELTRRAVLAEASARILDDRLKEGAALAGAEEQYQRQRQQIAAEANAKMAAVQAAATSQRTRAVENEAETAGTVEAEYQAARLRTQQEADAKALALRQEYALKAVEISATEHAELGAEETTALSKSLLLEETANAKSLTLKEQAKAKTLAITQLAQVRQNEILAKGEATAKAIRQTGDAKYEEFETKNIDRALALRTAAYAKSNEVEATALARSIKIKEEAAAKSLAIEKKADAQALAIKTASAEKSAELLNGFSEAENVTLEGYLLERLNILRVGEARAAEVEASALRTLEVLETEHAARKLELQSKSETEVQGAVTKSKAVLEAIETEKNATLLTAEREHQAAMAAVVMEGVKKREGLERMGAEVAEAEARSVAGTGAANAAGAKGHGAGSYDLRHAGFGLMMTAGLLAAPAIEAMKSYTEFDAQLHKILAQAGERLLTFNDLQKRTLLLSRELGVAPATVASTLFNDESAGFHGDAAFTMSKSSLRLGIATRSKPEDAANLLTKVLTAYSQPASAAPSLSNKLVTAVGQSHTDMTRFGPGVANAAQDAAQAHIDVDSFLAAYATVTRVAPNSNIASTGLRNFFSHLVRPTPAMNKAFKAYGLDEYTEGKAPSELQKPGGFDRLLNRIKQVTHGNSAAMADIAPDLRTERGAFPLFGVDAEGRGFKEIHAEQKNSAGATDRAYEEQNKSFERKLERFHATANAFMMEFVGIARGMAEPVIERLIGLGNQLIDGWNKLPEGTKKAIVATLALVTGLIGLAGAIATIGFFVGPVLEVLGGMGKMFFSVNPIRLGLVAGLLALALAWKDNTGHIREHAAVIGKFLLKALLGVVGAVASLISWYQHLSPTSKKVFDDVLIGVGVFLALRGAQAKYLEVLPALIKNWGLMRGAGVAVWTAFSKIPGLWTALIGVFGRASTAFGGFLALLRAAPGVAMRAAAPFALGGVVILALIGLGVELYKLKQSWDTMREAQDEAAQSAQNYANKLGQLQAMGGRSALIAQHSKNVSESSDLSNAVTDAKNGQATGYLGFGEYPAVAKLLRDKGYDTSKPGFRSMAEIQARIKKLDADAQTMQVQLNTTYVADKKAGTLHGPKGTANNGSWPAAGGGQLHIAGGVPSWETAAAANSAQAAVLRKFGELKDHCGDFITAMVAASGAARGFTASAGANNPALRIRPDAQGNYPPGTLFHLGAGGKGTTRHYTSTSDGVHLLEDETYPDYKGGPRVGHVSNRRTVDQIRGRILQAYLPTPAMANAWNQNHAAPEAGEEMQPPPNPALPPGYYKLRQPKIKSKAGMIGSTATPTAPTFPSTAPSVAAIMGFASAYTKADAALLKMSTTAGNVKLKLTALDNQEAHQLGFLGKHASQVMLLNTQLAVNAQRHTVLTEAEKSINKEITAQAVKTREALLHWHSLSVELTSHAEAIKKVNVHRASLKPGSQQLALETAHVVRMNAAYGKMLAQYHDAEHVFVQQDAAMKRYGSELQFVRERLDSVAKSSSRMNETLDHASGKAQRDKLAQLAKEHQTFFENQAADKAAKAPFDTRRDALNTEAGQIAKDYGLSDEKVEGQTAVQLRDAIAGLNDKGPGAALALADLDTVITRLSQIDASEALGVTSAARLKLGSISSDTTLTKGGKADALAAALSSLAQANAPDADSTDPVATEAALRAKNASLAALYHEYYGKIAVYRKEDSDDQFAEYIRQTQDSRKALVDRALHYGLDREAFKSALADKASELEKRLLGDVALEGVSQASILALVQQRLDAERAAYAAAGNDKKAALKTQLDQDTAIANQLAATFSAGQQAQKKWSHDFDGTEKVAHQVGERIGNDLGDMVTKGKHHMESLKDIMRDTFADILKQIIVRFVEGAIVQLARVSFNSLTGQGGDDSDGTAKGKASTGSTVGSVVSSFLGKGGGAGGGTGGLVATALGAANAVAGLFGAHSVSSHSVAAQAGPASATPAAAGLAGGSAGADIGGALAGTEGARKPAAVGAVEAGSGAVSAAASAGGGLTRVFGSGLGGALGKALPVIGGVMALASLASSLFGQSKPDYVNKTGATQFASVAGRDYTASLDSGYSGDSGMRQVLRAHQDALARVTALAAAPQTAVHFQAGAVQVLGIHPGNTQQVADALTPVISQRLSSSAGVHAAATGTGVG